MPNPWESFEAIPGQETTSPIWQKRMGEAYEAFRRICLEPSDWFVDSYPCPRKCGCWHRVILRHDHNAAVGACRCQPPACPDLQLTLTDITPLRVSWTRLGRELCHAFGFVSKFQKLVPYNTYQIGSWSSDAVPAIVTIQIRNFEFLSAVAQLAATLRRPFILFAPTSDQITANCQSILENFGAAFYALDSHTIITPDGSLRPARPPGQLFARFSPEPANTEATGRTPAKETKPRYALRKGLGVWHLTFDGKEAILKHERGVFYVAWLLYHPDETPIHALDLMAKIPELYRQQLGLPALVDPSTGKVAPLQSGARIQERSLAIDDAEAMRAVFKKEKELEAILDDPSESEPVKAEALRELEEILEFQRHHARRSKDSAQRAVRSVRMAITRFHHRLLLTLQANGTPNPVLQQVASHIERHLIIPSTRYSATTATSAKGPHAGCFTYRPPPGIGWAQ